MRGAPLLAGLAILLAGCAELPADGGAPRPSLPAPDPQVLAYRASIDDAPPYNSTLFVVREQGNAERILFVDDHAASVRLAPGIDYPVDDLERMFSARGGNVNRSTGGLVLRVEHGHIPEPAWSTLQQAIARGAWPPGDQQEDYHDGQDYVRFVGGRAELARTPPVDPAFAPVVAAFDAAERAFVVARVDEPDAPPQPDAPPGQCLASNATVTPEAVLAGESVTIRIDVENCGSEPATVGASSCDEPPLALAYVNRRDAPGSYVVRAGEGAHAAYAVDFRCRGEPAPTVIEPLGRATLTVRWNGTFAACDAGGACEFERAPPGNYHVTSFVTGQEYARPAQVTLLPRDPPEVRLLVAREHDWVNTTSDEPIMGDFGPHCAPATYTLHPPAVTLRFWQPDTIPPALVVRDWRDGHRPNHTVTVSADQLDILGVAAEPVALTSPFDATFALANVTLDGDAFVVDGARIGPNETLTLRRTLDLERDGATYRTTSILVLENVGAAYVLREPAHGCM